MLAPSIPRGLRFSSTRRAELRSFISVKLLIPLATLLIATHGFAQGTVMQAHLQTWPTPDGVTALAFFNVPAPSDDPAMLQSVSYDVTINSESRWFSQCRIAGGGTRWSWFFNNPTIGSGFIRYSGSTEMVPHQLNDVLAGLTEFELVNGELQVFMLGQIVPVPEPNVFTLLALSLSMIAFKYFRRSTLS